MIKNCVFQLPSDSKDIITTFGLNEILTTTRTTIYENDKMRFCIDKNVVRVLIFDNTNAESLELLRCYFYGEEYENI